MKSANILETIGNTPHVRVNRLFGDQAEVMRRRLRYFSIRRIATSHHGSAPWIIDSFSSGKR